MDGVADLEIAKAREQPPVTGVARGKYAIEHVDTGDDPATMSSGVPTPIR